MVKGWIAWLGMIVRKVLGRVVGKVLEGIVGDGGEKVVGKVGSVKGCYVLVGRGEGESKWLILQGEWPTENYVGWDCSGKGSEHCKNSPSSPKRKNSKLLAFWR